jgi:hypothetical protein
MYKNILNQFLLATLLTFQWNAPVSGPAPTGYKLIYGDSASTMNQSMDLGNVLTKDLSFDIVVPKYFAIRTYNQFGDGATTNPIVVGVPGPAQNLIIKLK